jgi:hypothetical protein
MTDPLLSARAKLCDLLIGRLYRAHAQIWLESGITVEQGDDIPRRVIDDFINQAANIEWIASLAEQGLIRFGGRLNRCGYQPECDSDD